MEGEYKDSSQLMLRIRPFGHFFLGIHSLCLVTALSTGLVDSIHQLPHKRRCFSFNVRLFWQIFRFGSHWHLGAPGRPPLGPERDVFVEDSFWGHADANWERPRKFFGGARQSDGRGLWERHGDGTVLPCVDADCWAWSTRVKVVSKLLNIPHGTPDVSKQM
ncbi:hypothetical protein BDU57DRAFT_520563 [Ampelomyces quisqualis]|uniref:Uncharacterized protein n=1 Tax=Ampelomyces quisqualis TaxID=50730 RepID=A0A6A5QE20_AMPQU|nr:hypothetical protein BDU57DRAFT_520563 [Ampelomyces quisqualis]